MDTQEIITILENYKNELKKINKLLDEFYSYHVEYLSNVSSENKLEKFMYRKIRTLKELSETYNKYLSAKNDILKEIYKIISEYSDSEEVRNYWIEVSSEIVKK